MSEIEKAIEDFKNELRTLVEKFEEEHGLLLVDVKYDGFSKKVNYTVADGNAKFVRLNDIK